MGAANSVRPRRRLRWWGLALALCVGSAGAKAPLVRIDGLGWLGDREAEQSLTFLLGETAGALDAAAIEDAALILLSMLEERGFLAPRIAVHLRLADGRELEHALDAALTNPLPRPLAVKEARIQIRKGPRYTYREVRFTGLDVLPEAAARAFFRGGEVLVPVANERIYSPGRLTRSLGNLQAELRHRGYAEARTAVGNLAVDHETGAVRLTVAVDEGALQRVRRLEFAVADDAPAPTAAAAAERVGGPWSVLWEQDTITWLRRWYYRHGYPDVQIELRSEVTAAARSGTGERAVTAVITPGPVVRLGRVRFAGNVHTKEALLRRRVRLEEGGLFDPAAIDSGQSRLSRLGVFDRVDVQAEPVDAATRDVLYRVDESRRQEVNLLAGYGSYEQLRGGVEWRHFNLWGRAHTDNLQVVQSMKSSRGRYTYTVPELFGTRLEGSARLFGLHREELAFTRDEYGANVAVQWPWRSLRAQVSVGHTLQRLRITHNDLATRPTDLEDVDSSSFNFSFVQDRRDNPLTPRRGTRVFAQTEVASRWFGGDADFQQVRFGGSYHTAWGAGRWIHVGFVHGFVLTLGADDDRRLPVSARFFPGGDGSQRGYRDGGAAPRAANGQFVGAKSYLQLNLELEQAITSAWSVVVFGDAVGTAAEIADYPFSEELYAVGLGIRYRTPIGPLRLEYGHNLNPRPRDPAGTLHLSIGVPF